MSWSVVGEFDPPLAEPGDWSGVAVESGLTEDRVVAPAVEADGEAVGLAGGAGQGGFAVAVIAAQARASDPAVSMARQASSTM